jgi:tRNA(Ile)-lysidine synthase
MFKPEQRFLVATSGGADSMLALNRVVEAYGASRVTAMHVNYHLRGAESNADARFVVDSCRYLGIECNRYDAQTKPPRNVQAWAREVRENIYEKARSDGLVVVTGHNRSDAAETIMMQLFRGTSPLNLKPMLFYDGRVLRPLIHMGRMTVRETCRQRNLAFREDSSNNETAYSRNYLRHCIMPDVLGRWPEAETKILEFASSVSQLVGTTQPETDELSVLDLDRPIPEAIHTLGFFLKSRAPGIRLSRDLLLDILLYMQSGSFARDLPGVKKRLVVKNGNVCVADCAEVE